MLMAHDMMRVTYDLPLVALSILIASVSAYVALSLGERVTQNHGRVRYLWLAGGACAMGTGIWSMHFTGILCRHHVQRPDERVRCLHAAVLDAQNRC
jgi:NO-binding membrane sensor protein with MHYT domain